MTVVGVPEPGTIVFSLYTGRIWLLIEKHEFHGMAMSFCDLSTVILKDYTLEECFEVLDLSTVERMEKIQSRWENKC